MALREKLRNGKFEGVTPSRSRHMGAIRGKGNRTTELRLRFALVSAGISGWVVHPKGLPGNPDFLFRGRAMTAVFVDGCFWHGCPLCGHVPKKNSGFWTEKIARNRARDASKAEELRGLGFAVIRFWEHTLRDDLGRCVAAIRDAIQITTPTAPD